MKDSKVRYRIRHVVQQKNLAEKEHMPGQDRDVGIRQFAGCLCTNVPSSYDNANLAQPVDYIETMNNHEK